MASTKRYHWQILDFAETFRSNYWHQGWFSETEDFLLALLRLILVRIPGLAKQVGTDGHATISGGQPSQNV